VGPNLVEFAGKPAEDFVVAILDPNAVIEPKFAAYEVETKDGRSLHGVVKNETATSLSVAQANGLEEKVLRSEIKELRASTLSLMPEGLEQAIAPQDMADLIAWLKQAEQGTNLRTTASRQGSVR
jgi:putative heme-binding domain-containing protein